MNFKITRDIPEEPLTTEERFALLGGYFFVIILLLVVFIGILIAENFRLQRELREEREICAPADTTIVAEETGDQQLSDWQVLLLAVAMTESEFYPTAQGNDNDWGMLQLTPIYVEEANRVTGEVRWSHDENKMKEFPDIYKIFQNLADKYLRK